MKRPTTASTSRGRAHPRRRKVPTAVRSCAQRRSAALSVPRDADHLVVVAGHAVTMAEDLSDVAREDASWYLLDYQRGTGAPGEFVRHARRGAEVAARDPSSVLVFSGGQTRADAGPRSEAQSYWLVAEHFGWWGAAA